MDITKTQDLGFSFNALRKKKPTFPSKSQFPKLIHPILKNLTTLHIKSNLKEFTSFYTRYYKSNYGKQSSEWLDKRIEETAPARPFKHNWLQSSLNCNYFRGDKKDGCNRYSSSLDQPFPPSLLGADDDGSGTVTILEALRAISDSEFISKHGGFQNTLEFHWHSAEKGGLLGSQAIFSSYEQDGRDIVAMLQQDMTGFVRRTLAAEKPESVGVITDFGR